MSASFANGRLSRRGATAAAAFTAMLASLAVAAPQASGADVTWNTRTGQGAPYFEWRWATVSGAFRGIVITLHPGGWVSDRSYVRKMDEEVWRFRNAGYATLSVTYTSNDGPRAVQDAIGFHEWMKHAFPHKGVCLVGSSAGGHLALMAAALDPAIRCAISQAGPTDLARPTSRQLRDVITRAFGTDPEVLARYSPLNHADALRGEIYLGHARHDPVVEYQQAKDLSDRTTAWLTEIPGGGPVRWWVHSTGHKPTVDLHYHRAVNFVHYRMGA